MSSVRIRPGTLSIKKKDRITPTFFLTPSRPPASGGSRAPCALSPVFRPLPSPRRGSRATCAPSHLACASLFYARRFCAFLLIRPISRPLPSPCIRGKSCSVRPIPCFPTPPVPPASGGSRAPCALSHMACASLFSARRFCAFFSSVCFEYNKFCLPLQCHGI